MGDSPPEMKGESLGTLVAVSLRTTGGKVLNNKNSTVTTEFDTNSTDYVEVSGSETEAINLSVSGDFYVAASLNSTECTGPATGFWRLEYAKGDPNGDWEPLGQEVSRLMTDESDVGIVSLCAVLQNQTIIIISGWLLNHRPVHIVSIQTT